LAVSNGLVSSVANFCVSVEDHAEGNEKLPSMFAEARRVVVLRSCILECWWLDSEDVGGKSRLQVAGLGGLLYRFAAKSRVQPQLRLSLDLLLCHSLWVVIHSGLSFIHSCH
jgi:hypothetical protein